MKRLAPRPEFSGVPALAHGAWRWILLALGLGVLCGPGQAQVLPEAELFDTAARAFQDRNYEYAEKTFGEFTKHYPMSTRWSEALARQGQARFELKQYTGVVELLQGGLSLAGPIADEYHYWIGQAQLLRGNFSEAASAFAKIVQGFPGSRWRLDAAFGESVSHFRRGDLRKAADLITTPGNAFQQLAGGKAASGSDVVYRGYLLAAEAFLGTSRAESALEALLRIEAAKVVPELAWQREHAVFRAQLALARTNLALRAATNLVETSKKIAEKSYAARSHAGWAALLEATGDLDGAFLAFTNNLAPGLVEELRRDALLRLTSIKRKQDREAEMAQYLESFLGQAPDDKQADLARVQWSDLTLAMHWRSTEGTTLPSSNAPAAALAKAIPLLDKVVAGGTNGPYHGQAFWLRGWCRWVLSGTGTETNLTLSALGDFEQAASLLPAGEDQALARFKAGDCALLLRQHARAAGHYAAVVQACEGSPKLKEGLMPQALFQLAESSIGARDQNTAIRAIERLFRDFPEKEYGGRGMLHVGQALAREGKPSEGRRLFEQLAEAAPQSPLMPEVKLAIARTHVKESNWKEAAAHYDRWLAAYTNHAAASAVSFDRAWLTERAGDDVKAAVFFAEFVERFPQHPEAPRASYWLGNHEYNLGEFVKAETHFQKAAGDTNAPSTLRWQARLAAGRSAFARLGYDEARAHFAAIVDDPKASPEEAAEALFALGDTFRAQPAAEAGKPLERFAEAIKAFNRVAQAFPTNVLAPVAWAKIGDCHVQLASLDPARYEQAAQAYTNALTHPLADLMARGEAEYGLGLVREKTGQLDLALEHYSNILYGKNLGPNEVPDPVTLEQAGYGAARVAELQRKPELVTGIYQRLIKELPEIAGALKARMDKAMERISGIPRAAAAN